MRKDPNIRELMREEVARVLRQATTAAVSNQTAAVGVSPGALAPSADSTDDLIEGTTNLFFTDARVYAAAKAMLQEGTNTTITADDEAMTLTISATGGAGGNDTVTRRRSWMGI